jgi:hypothetical protein
LGDFASIFRNVADAREGGWDSGLARFHLGENVERADEELAAQIAVRRRPSGRTCAMRWPSGIRNSPPPFRNPSAPPVALQPDRDQRRPRRRLPRGDDDRVWPSKPRRAVLPQPIRISHGDGVSGSPSSSVERLCLLSHTHRY